MVNAEVENKLVDAEGLLKALFPEDQRPTVRWVRTMQEKRRIPFIKLGALVYFDVEEVRKVISAKHTIAPAKS